MDRALEKSLEKVEKFKAKKQYVKARAAFEEIPLSQREQLDVVREALNLSLHLDEWPELLKVLRNALILHEFQALLEGSNLEPFKDLLHTHPPFVHALQDMLAHLKHLRGLHGWVELMDEPYREVLLQSWRQNAAETNDPAKRSLFLMSIGVGLMVVGDEVGAFQAWRDALNDDPRELKRVMAYCQGLGDQRDLTSRLRLIKLVAAAGKINETLTLLKALGNESDPAALRVLSEIHEIVPEMVKSKDVLALRYSMAVRLGDPELIRAVIADMDELTEDELFPFKKLALHQIGDKVLRQTVLIDFVRLYIRQENWENAAPLLQMLFEENPDPTVIGLMELVLDRFPIISSLRFLLGKYHVSQGNLVPGIQHLTTIAQVPEYDHRIRQLLEDRLLVQYDSEIAHLLVRMLPLQSSEAGLVACLMAVNDPRSFIAALPDWGEPHMREQTNPFWALALIRANLSLKRFDLAFPFLCQFLRRFPDLSPEAVHCAEQLGNGPLRDFTELIRTIDGVAERLQPKRAWAALRKHFMVATHNARTQAAGPQTPATPAAAVAQGAPAQPAAPVPPVVSAQPAAPVPPAAPVTPTVVAAPAAPAAPVTPAAVPERANPPVAETPSASNVPQEFQKFRGFLESGQHRLAAEMAEKTVAAYPQSILFVINQLERLSRENPREILWPITILRILITSAAFEKAVEVGRRVLAHHHFHPDMPHIYQLMARAFEGLDDATEALRFFCLSSRQGRFYELNRQRLLEMVLPNHVQFIDEVVQLVLNNEDQDAWDELMKNWYRHRPEDLQRIIQAQERFTEQLGSPRARLDLAFWYLQAGRLEDIDETLNQVDLHDQDILDYLTHIAHLAHLKYPEDPKPKFLLGKYYLVQQDVAKAVDTFRNLARQIPNSADTIYQFLRSYLKKNAADTDLVTLYGLLIRFALDYGTPVSAVRLLEELSRQNREGAATLINGVYRVILRKDDRLEAMYELLRLLHEWGDFERLLDVTEQGGFGDHMAAERLEWLEGVAKRADLRDRAMLSIAQIYFDTYDFSRCRESLRRIESGRFKRRALPLYDRLTERYPDQLDILREAGWAAFPQDPVKTRAFFSKLISADHFESRLEAYAVLRHLEVEVDFELLSELEEDTNRIYAELFQLHQRLRRVELAYWESADQPLSSNALNWLIDTGALARIPQELQHNHELGEVERALLEARCFFAQGARAQAAWHLVRHPVPCELQQSLFLDAGMVEMAVRIKKPGTRLPIFLQDAFLAKRGKPAMIAATTALVRPRMAAPVADPVPEVSA